MTDLSELSESLSSVAEAGAASALHLSAGCRRRATATALDVRHAITTAHAVGHRERVWLRDDGGARFEAEVAGRDPGTDLALLALPEDAALQAPRFREPDDAVKLGALVLALGRPGRALRASMRMLGAVASDVPTHGGATLPRYLETDRAIPSGFEGGPVLDLEGRVIGLQSRAAVRGADLIVAIETLREVAAELAAHGRVRSGFLGVSVRPIGLPDAARRQLSRRRGALVMGVAPGGPAESAGLHLGDVILGLDGVEVSGGRSLARALRARFGAPAPLEIWRTGAPASLTITPEERA